MNARVRRRLWLPVATVVIVLAASIAIPIGLRNAERSNRLELQETIYPLRAALQTQKSALQSGVAAQAGYVASGNPELLSRAERWVTVIDSLRPSIADMTERSPARVQRGFREIERRQSAMSELRPPDSSSRDELYDVIPTVDARQDSILQAFDELDAVLAEEIDIREERLAGFERTAGTANILLGILGLLAVLSVAQLVRAEHRARRDAEAAVALRDQVVSVVSHDLRNPLHTIGLASNLLLTTMPEDAPPSMGRNLRIIDRATDNMARMITDLLEVAQIESGRLSVQTQRADLARLLDNAVQMLRPVVEEKELSLISRLDGELPAVKVDPDRTVQILSNLVGNAAKFTPEGGSITLTVEADREVVWISVRDTGSGIPAEHIPHLFDRFWQASRTDRRGIGLGLSIVKYLVEAQGGEIEVLSTVGEGSDFRFSVVRVD